MNILNEQITWNCKRMTIACEVIKKDGYSPPETAKMNEYVWRISLL